MKMLYSVDGGLTFLDAPNGVIVQYQDVAVPGEDGPNEMFINADLERLSIDVNCSREDYFDHNIGCRIEKLDDLIERLVEENS